MLVLGHRGASGYAPENTASAFREALDLGCDGFELDVQRTRDGVVVVHHDWSLLRTTGTPSFIADRTYDEIAGLDVGSWFSEAFRGEPVPRLDDVLDLTPPDRLVNVEIKSRACDAPGLEEAVVALLEARGRLEGTIVSSFNHASLRRLGRIAPSLRLGLLYDGVLLDPWNYARREGLRLYSLHPAEEYLSADLVRRAHEEGLRVACWTVNDGDRARELESFGVDMVITNYPDRCRPSRP